MENISKIQIQVSNWQKISAVISQIKESLFLLLKISENSRDEKNKEAKKQNAFKAKMDKTRSDIHSYIHTQKVDFLNIKHIEECLTSFLVREMHVKVTEIFLPTHQTGKNL